MKEYKIWAEGFRVTGQEAPASFYGTVTANSFKEACALRFKNDVTYDPERNTLWGCRLFETEIAARKEFG